ncbi:MAG TPA: 1-(5-phosphoribosyl)-5-[(5-phosphoribosylamino)methylideneamino]imidazole-4-carboxamide isomerase [Gammaproteobacteria bacterium]|jgi:phosphoribosylformimino-5-aminoimidazole carboxamide ribotide isomerase|nr:1-(5-phosphoribosyl)-5-[(5-phosphoribosylamino)methylideneamino]imidazole-4-carboxamide isomerase [Gammaproteobacteria bacterium]HET7587074.1 1-(5-phosphoribosyl)-5-[(5-phosphoribosylamino)methylideneamino]imidazole-4-carboxamide isomerase [Gammaproteobacteria bacterium]
MLLIPAIDLRDGQCVRLKQGRAEDMTVISEDPPAIADRWVEAGAQRLHVVDLDGASNGAPANADAIRDIAARHPDLVLQVGGGIRDEDTVEAYLAAGVDYVIIGTRAVSTPHFVRDLCIEFAGHVIVGLDARNGKVATDGWSKLSNHDVIEVAQHFERDGVAAIVFTDIERDGMLAGANVEATAALAREVAIPVIASGGIAGLDDIRKLCAAREDGVMGAVISRALYEGQIDLGEAHKLVGSLSA